MNSRLSARVTLNGWTCHTMILQIWALLKSLTNLKALNTSHNKISSINLHIPCAPTLLRFDISNNNLTHLDDHTFELTTNLKFLNLSFNPFGDIQINTFSTLLDLEHSDLKHTNITRIQLGTFSHQHKLITLDLSENKLSKFDCKLFFPIMHDLLSLRLGGNQLEELIGFRNSLFPRLELLDIIDNSFNCSYLHQFMEVINWEKLHLHLALNSVQHEKTSIRGITCNDIIYEPNENVVPKENKSLEQILNENFSKLNLNLYSDTFIKVLLILIFIVNLSYLAVYLYLQRDRLQVDGSLTPQNRRISVVFKNNEQNESLLF